jgi:hypothetical protein
MSLMALRDRAPVRSAATQAAPATGTEGLNDGSAHRWSGVTFLLAACAGTAFTVYAIRRVTGRGRHTVALVVSGLLAAVPGWFAWQTHVLEERLTSAVRSLTGIDDVEVDCQGFLREFRLDRNLGEVAYGQGGTPSKTAGLRDAVCDHLADWLDSDRDEPSIEEITALHVLTHEAVHLMGVSDERAAECRAMQRDAAMAVLLGASPEQGQALASRYAAEVYPRMPNGYTSPGCSEDGEYDESPDDGVWP